MAYAFINQTSQGNASGAGLTVTKPTSTVDGNLIVILGYLESDTNTWSSVGAGFTSAGTWVNTGDFKMQVWWKIASGEPASWTWTPTTSAWRTVCAASYSGALGSGGTRVDVFGVGAQSDAAISQNAASVTTTATHDLLVGCCGNFGGGAYTESGAAPTERSDFGGVCLSDTVDVASAGATGTTNFSAGTNDYAANHVAFFLDTGGGAVAPFPPFPPTLRVIVY